MKHFKKLKDFIQNNKLLFFLFSFSLIFFIVQHYFLLNWDFIAYVLNAKNFFSTNGAFEIYRAPMASFIMRIFLFFGKFMEYFFIILVASLFFYSSIKLSDTLYERYFNDLLKNLKFKINKNFFRVVFYFFLLTPFLLRYATLLGTELLGLSFFMLFLTYFLQNKLSGHFLCLAFLTRYNFLIFLPILFFNRNWKKILLNLGVFILTFVPAFLFYLFKYGNGFASIVDSYNLNIFSRQHLFQSFDILGLFSAINWLLVFFIIGLFFSFYFVKKFKLSFKIPFLFLLIFLFVIFDWCQTPFKIYRYLFNLSLPIAFFSCIGFICLLDKIKLNKNYFYKKIKIFIFIIFIIFIIFLIVNIDPTSNKYEKSVNDLEKFNLNGCVVLSPSWVMINYYSETAFFLPYDIEKALSQNKIVVIFQNFETIDGNYTFNKSKNYPGSILRENYSIIIPENLTKENCPKWNGYGNPSVSNQCKFISDRLNFLGLKNFLFKSCNLINIS